MLASLSHRWARVEIFLASLFAVSVTILILLNVITRAMNASIYWVDEAAIYAMVWMCFLAASAGIHERNAVAVTMIKDALHPSARRILGFVIDLIVMIFALAMIYFLWRWLMPLDLARAGFDTQTFQGETFNFVYAEPTTTLGFRKIWIWLVMVLFTFGATLHAAANLVTGPAPTDAEVRP